MRQRTETAIAKQAKKAGIAREEFVRERTRAVSKSAQEQGWRRSETAMMLADVIEAADKVYGKEIP